MSDLKRQLRSYIDGLEEPVSIQETMARGQKRRRLRAPVAVLAGAAVVLIPALVLVGLRMLPGDDSDVAETTTPPTSVTTTTVGEDTTTTAPPVSAVAVPDLDGLTEAEARELLAGLGLDLEVTERYPSRSDFGIITAQDPGAGEAVDTGSTVVVGVRVAAECLGGVPTPEVPEGSMAVRVFFECAGDGFYPDISSPITRVVADNPDAIEATLNALLAGLTDTERSMGFGSFFSEQSARALNSVTLSGDRLLVDFNDGILLNNASTSAGSMYFLSELEANLFQFEQIESIEFQLNGSCDAFMGWLQGECQVFTRGDWEDWLEYREAQNDARPETGHEIDPTQVVGLVFTATLVDGSNGIDQLLDGRRLDSGFDEVGGWLLDDASTEEMRNWAIHVAGQEVEMVWLAEGRGHTDEGHLMYEVRAVVELPWDEVALTGDPLLMSGNDACSRDGEYDPTLVVMAAMGGNVNGEATELRAWSIDITGATFVEMPLTGIECAVEAAG